jgi:phosphoglycerate kinase
MTDFLTLKDIDAAGRTILVRADLNVPMAEGRVTDATRIERFAPTAKVLADAGARVVILSHFGRPKGEVKSELSLKSLVGPLGEELGQPVGFLSDCIGPMVKSAVAAMTDGEIILLENLRFHAGEEANDPGFAAALAELGDQYVNDAFSCAHRAHASTEGITHKLPSAAGLLMEAELQALGAALEAPKRPVTAVVGGAKISTKLELLGSLVSKVDRLIIGGGMANTFLAAQGVDVAKSLCEHEMADTALEVLAKAKSENCTIYLPVDAVVAREFAANVPTETVSIDAVPSDAMILDVGPDSIRQSFEVIESSATLVWNGPLGAFEIIPFDTGTKAVAQAAARLTRDGSLLSVAGGGDTVAALAAAGVEDQFSYVSTAGGAFLEWLEGKELPGVAALRAAAESQ